MAHLRFQRSSWICFGGVLLLYALLILPTVTRQGISWDEQNDLWVAQAYLRSLDGWLVGSEIDPSQTRLPMFAVALIYKVLGVSDLITARLVSCFVGGLTLLAVFLYCKWHFKPSTGILACLLLATSPFFLSFARVAFTETDIYLACVLAWLMIFVSQFQAHPTLGRATLVGIFLGLALSAKFTALATLPALWFVLFRSRTAGFDVDIKRIKASRVFFWAGWLFACLIAGLLAVHGSDAKYGSSSSRLMLYLLVLSGWVIPVFWSVFHHSAVSSWIALACYLTGLALLTFLLVPPEHLTNPVILRSLLWRAEHELAFNPGFILEATGLHIGSLIFKSGPVIGIGMLLSFFLTVFQWHNSPQVRFPVLLVLFYFIGLVLLPLAQTFYLIPLLPVLAIFAAAQFMRLFARRRLDAVGLAALAGVLLAIDLALCYPDYNLNGFQWLGERRIAGRSSVGYRSIVQTPSDGVEQVIRWLNENAKPGDSVRSYLLEWHIIQAVAPRPAYRIENGFDSPSPNPKYVVLEINTQVRQSWWTDTSRGEIFLPPYDPAWLERNYTKVFSVRRAFGIEMASVWRKK